MKWKKLLLWCLCSSQGNCELLMRNLWNGNCIKNILALQTLLHSHSWTFSSTIFPSRGLFLHKNESLLPIFCINNINPRNGRLRENWECTRILSVYSQNTLRMLLCIKLLLELFKLRNSHTYNIIKKVKWRWRNVFRLEKPTGFSNWKF